MRRRLVVVVGVLVVVAGCGGAEQRHAASPTARTTPTATTTARGTAPSPLEACPSAGGGWRSLPTSGYYSPPAAHLAGGRVGAVFANDSVNDTCAWSSEARWLAGHGFAVAVFQTVGNAAFEAKQVLAVARALRRTRVHKIALIGASVGARAVLQAGAQQPPGVVGVVALSAERRITSNPADLLPVGRHVRLPVLSIGSRRDPLTAFGKDTLAWHRIIPNDRTLILSGSDHGVDLLHNRHRQRVRATILTFLRSL
jgi:pimeloyl-ACP methyl ester carboxylesterase